MHIPSSPFRHSRESGNPVVLSKKHLGLSVRGTGFFFGWIPAFAGMTTYGVAMVCAAMAVGRGSYGWL